MSTRKYQQQKPFIENRYINENDIPKPDITTHIKLFFTDYCFLIILPLLLLRNSIVKLPINYTSFLSLLLLIASNRIRNYYDTRNAGYFDVMLSEKSDIR